MENNNQCLPHLTPTITAGIDGNYLDAYAVALEGWRRGLTLKWHQKDVAPYEEIKTWYVDQPGLLFSLHSKEKSHYFFRTRGDKVTKEAVQKGMDKQITKEILAKKGVAIPEGKLFNSNHTDNEIIDYCTTLTYPIVIKPLNGSFGKGVVSDINGEEELKKALQYVRQELNEKSIIAERHVNGNDYRLYVVNNKVVGAILRVPPNVTGDGTSTIETLIKQKNKLRSKNPRLVSCPIQVNNETIEYLEKNHYTLETVLDKDKTVLLNNKANISLGGDPIDVLDDLSEEMKTIAVKALKAVPNLDHGAVDLMIETSGEVEKGYVIELNPTAQLGGILFPIQGQPRDVPSAIIDYYFPETEKTDKNVQMYFNYHKALLPLKKGVAITTKMANLIPNTMTCKKLLIEGEFSRINSLTAIKNQAIRLNINGYVNLQDDKVIEIIALCNDKSFQQLKSVILEFENELQVTDMKEEDWHEPVMLGFYIQDSDNELRNEIQQKGEELVYNNQRIRKLEKEFENIVNSSSWKLTAPVRKITGGLKKALNKN